MPNMGERKKSGLYGIDLREEARDTILRFGDQSQQLGIYPRCSAVFKTIEHNLKFIPLLWGDRLSSYNRLQVQKLRGMIPNWFLVWYVVHMSSRTVSVHRVGLAPGCPLTE